MVSAKPGRKAAALAPSTAESPSAPLEVLGAPDAPGPAEAAAYASGRIHVPPQPPEDTEKGGARSTRMWWSSGSHSDMSAGRCENTAAVIFCHTLYRCSSAEHHSRSQGQWSSVSWTSPCLKGILEKGGPRFPVWRIRPQFGGGGPFQSNILCC